MEIEPDKINVAAETAPLEAGEDTKLPPAAESEPAAFKKEEESLRSLLEKNLKWSQIIYEQNRRIGRQLLLGAIATWIKWMIFLGVIIFGAYFAWPIVRDLQAEYSMIISEFGPGRPLDKATVDRILKILPLDAAQQEQVKSLTK